MRISIPSGPHGWTVDVTISPPRTVKLVVGEIADHVDWCIQLELWGGVGHYASFDGASTRKTSKHNPVLCYRFDEWVIPDKFQSTEDFHVLMRITHSQRTDVPCGIQTTMLGPGIRFWNARWPDRCADGRLEDMLDPDGVRRAMQRHSAEMAKRARKAQYATSGRAPFGGWI